MLDELQEQLSEVGKRYTSASSLYVYICLTERNQ